MRIQNIIFSVAVAILLSLSCGQTTREDLLSGNFGNVDKSPPKLIAPADNARVTPNGQGELKTTLVWESRAGATSYLVEIARDQSFSQPVTGSPFAIKSEGGQPPKTSMEWIAPDSFTYYWRVRASTTVAGQYSAVNALHAMDAVYVYCPASETNCTNSGKWGNKSSPFQVIQDSLYVAKGLGLEVRVAARLPSGSYNESLALVGGVTLKGGFEADNWQRDIPVNVTRVHSTNSKTIQGSFLVSETDFYLDGFYVTNGSDISNVDTVFLEGPNNRLILQNNTIRGGLGTISNRALTLTNQSSVRIQNNLIIGPPSGNTVSGIYVENESRPVITQNEIRATDYGATTAFSYGITVSSSHALITYNYIHAGESSSLSPAVWGLNSSLILVGNRIIATNSKIGIESSTTVVAVDNSVICTGSCNIGIQTSGVNAGWLNHNLIMHARNSTFNSMQGAVKALSNSNMSFSNNIVRNSGNGVLLEVATPDIAANIFWVNSGSGPAIRENHANANPVRVAKNLFFREPVSTFNVYRDFDGNCNGGATPECASVSDMEADLNAETVGSSFGNVLHTGGVAGLFAHYPLEVLELRDGLDANSTYPDLA